MLNLWDAYIRAAQVGWDANVVVATRLMRLAVGGALPQREAQRMVAEKVNAFTEAQEASTTKMIMGRGRLLRQDRLLLFISGSCMQTDVALPDADFVVPGRPALNCARRCRVFGAKRKSCVRPEHYRF
jgi:hypothetical protein